jgi:hypothetical protein
MSYAFLLIARVAAMRRRGHELVDLLTSAREFYQRRDYVCHLRIGLGLSECLAAEDSSEASRLALAIQTEADSRRLHGLSDLAGRTTRLIRRFRLT